MGRPERKGGERMEKPTIFFSHSSHDRELILPVKAKLDMITAQVLDIFMSSDGQSIPFGKDVYKRQLI